MTDLQLAPPRESSPLKAVLIAAVILAIIAAAVVFLNPRKTAELSVTKVDTFAPHTQFRLTPGAVHVLGQAEASEDDLYVAATVKLEDKLRLPIFASSFGATLTAGDGTALEGTSIAARDWPRLETSFPALAPMLAQPLPDGAEADPGSAVTGTVLLMFPGASAETWAKKRSATLRISLAHQGAQTVGLP